MTPKDVITPIQNWLLSEGRCSGCGSRLSGGGGQKTDKVVTCSCARKYRYVPERHSFQRAYIAG